MRYKSTEINFLKDNLDKGNKELGELLNRSADSVKYKIKTLGLSRTKKQVMALYLSNNAGQFKKGNVPHNYKNGEFISKDGYIIISLGNCRQRLKHIYRWEKLYGPLPKGHCLRCITENITNTNPDNWQLITRAKNMKMNSIHRYPKSLIASIKLVSKLNKAL